MAGLLCASVLALVAGSTAQAANTSRELLVDTNSDGVGDAREFGGRDRYDTALRLARNFAAGKGGRGQVPVAFVASGATLVDAVAVSGLAGHEDAPVLLTQRRSLHNGVADFLEDNDVGTVYVLGGPAAVADSVLDELEALDSEPRVSRIEGADRYATAAAIGSELGGGSSWCGSDEASAILVNGGDVSLAYAMMVGPLAYRLELPVLLTARRTLPEATAEFLRTEDIEHVVIVGGPGSVAASVETDLVEAGVDTIERVAGSFATGTSVALAELAMDECAADLRPVSRDTVALVHTDALPDGVAAAPVLAATFARGDLVPMLLVNDTLPTTVRDYLAATPDVDADGDKLELKIVAIGGTAAVGADVVDEALREAGVAEALNVRIGGSSDTDGDGAVDADDVPIPGDTSVILYFSGTIEVDAASLTSTIRDIVELNGAPARLAAGNAVNHVSANDPCEPDEVTLSFANPLRARDLISIISGATLGSGANAQQVRGTSVEVTAPSAARTRPTVDVFLVIGRFDAKVTLSDGGPLNEEDVELRSANANKTVSVNPVTSDMTFSEALEAGDRVLVKRGAIVDADGNRSTQRTFRAMEPDKNPTITSVLMSDLNHTSQAAAEVPTEIAGPGNSVLIVARARGAAAGAAGNGWSMIFDVASTWTSKGDVDIDVTVNAAEQTVFVRFTDGPARNRDLQQALEADAAFDALFEVEPPADFAGGCGAIQNRELSLGTNDRQIGASFFGGVTAVAIEVRFDGYVENVDDDGLLEDILRAVVSHRKSSTDLVRIALDLESPTLFEGPGKVVRYEARTSNAAMLPGVRDLVDTAAGRDQVFDDPDTQADESADAAAPVATGYAPAENDDEKNGRSQVRIARSSDVEPPV